jgi:uncharacterized protein (DUF1697 family)
MRPWWRRFRSRNDAPYETETESGLARGESNACQRESSRAASLASTAREGVWMPSHPAKSLDEGTLTVSRRHVALIRGINVGRAKRVAMADLRALVEDLGYGDVRTLLNSGNIVFTVPASARKGPATRIEDAITARLGISARVTVLTRAELAAVIADNPLGGVAHDPSRLFVTVLTDPADRKRLLPLARQDWTPDVLAVGARVAYLWCPQGMLESRLAAAVSRLLGDAATTRNWATVTKLHALVEGGR